MANCIAGEPGWVCGFDRRGNAIVEWTDLPEVGRTTHRLETLVIDESFKVTQLGLDFTEVAA